MTITIKLFAILKDRAGTSQTKIEIPAGTGINHAVERLARQYPTIQPFLCKLAYAVNEHYMPVTTELHDGDELALIPPVSGG